MASNDELLAILEQWLSDQSAATTIFDVIDTRDRDLIGAYILKAFRQGARNAVLDRLEREGQGIASIEDPRAVSAIFRLFDRISEKCGLTETEGLELLGLGDPAEVASLRIVSLKEVPIHVIERVVLLLDIYQAIGALLPQPDLATAWVRKANAAPIFKGNSALDLMMHNDLDGIRAVRAYLQAEIWAG